MVNFCYYFIDCMGIIYQQMDTRHKLHCTFKESLYINLPDIGDDILKAADIFIQIHSLGSQ